MLWTRLSGSKLRRVSIVMLYVVVLYLICSGVVGIWMCRGKDMNAMVMDVEGTDGRERGEDQVRSQNYLPNPTY